MAVLTPTCPTCITTPETGSPIESTTVPATAMPVQFGSRLMLETTYDGSDVGVAGGGVLVGGGAVAVAVGNGVLVGVWVAVGVGVRVSVGVGVIDGVRVTVGVQVGGKTGVSVGCSGCTS